MVVAPLGEVVVLLRLEKVKPSALPSLDESTYVVVVVVRLLLVELLVPVASSVHPGGNSPGMMHGTPVVVDVGSAVVLSSNESLSHTL